MPRVHPSPVLNLNADHLKLQNVKFRRPCVIAASAAPRVTSAISDKTFYTPTVVLLSALALRYAFHPCSSIFAAFPSTSSAELAMYLLMALISRPGSNTDPSPSSRSAGPPEPAVAAAAAPEPSIRTAKSPAFVAFPIPTVATGTPRGICTMLWRESTPLRVEVLTGTPMTGSGVMAATIPGRCAAPPAPAMMTRIPREDAS